MKITGLIFGLILSLISLQSKAIEAWRLLELLPVAIDGTSAIIDEVKNLDLFEGEEDPQKRLDQIKKFKIKLLNSANKSCVAGNFKTAYKDFHELERNKLIPSAIESMKNCSNNLAKISDFLEFNRNRSYNIADCKKYLVPKESGIHLLYKEYNQNRSYRCIDYQTYYEGIVEIDGQMVHPYRRKTPRVAETSNKSYSSYANIDYDYLTKLFKTGICGTTKFSYDSVTTSNARIADCFSNHYSAKADYENALIWTLVEEENAPHINWTKGQLKNLKKRLGESEFNKIRDSYHNGSIAVKKISDFVYKSPTKLTQKTPNKSSSFSDLWKQNGGEFVDSISNIEPNKEINSKTTYVDNSDFSIKINQKDNNQIQSDRFLISGLIESGNQIKSILINGSELGFADSGRFSKELYISLGENRFVIEAVDIFGNKAIKNVAVNRVEPEASINDPQLVPPKSLVKSDDSAIALIFGMEKYKSMPRANWADSDANIFYDFAIKTLGVKPENIERLINEESNYANIWKTIDNWLNSKVEQGKSKVYVYFAGHGLASEDGSTAYLLPYDADSAILRRTAIPRQEIIQAIAKLKPRKATFFMDTCYSGNAKGGDKLLVASRGLRVVKKNQYESLPDNFTIFSAARSDETAISHPSQKNGLFSYWLMRGLSGDADLDSNKEITNTELFDFLSNKVSRTAISKGQKQNPELFGERDEVISSWKSGFFN